MSSEFQHPAGTDRGARRWSQALAVRGSRRALAGGAVAFAFVGALTSPPYVVLVVAPTCGILVGGVTALVNPAFPEARSARRATVYSAAGAALVVLSLAGLGQFGSAGTVAAVVLMILACIGVSGWLADDPGPPARGAAAPALDAQELQRFVQVLPTSMLLREWRTTTEHLQPDADPDRWAEAVLVRTLLLEELTRRDSAGVATWLSEGDEGSPERHLRDDRDAST